ncbi:Pycsar system effector family protein [Thomasclavelia cocleata]|jgi:hypothetical protein|uniref:Pycsar system effector family protein n=1 Tax=Thomasclavelia cocleata TaxID=69824 RepID=UPI00206A152C|nr:Pycsar system effector family protein [Thomasclavelia cocleata]MCI9630212.1 hypothetical protein [Thomasclavelia cocleata]DAQ67277.1 MAG TPA: hypothetical protein [Caudoviricetes sp.]
MGQNNNQNSTGQGFKKDDAYQTLSMINTWIGNIDTKISFALALAGVLIGMIFSGGLPNAFQRITQVSKLSELNGGEIFAVLLVGLLYCASFLSIVSFMWAIIARVKNLNNASSLFFFGSIGAMELQNYRDKANQITEQDLIDDLEEQIHTNSRICNQKAKWYNNGIKFLLITIILWFICMAFRMI